MLETNHGLEVARRIRGLSESCYLADYLRGEVEVDGLEGGRWLGGITAAHCDRNFNLILRLGWRLDVLNGAYVLSDKPPVAVFPVALLFHSLHYSNWRNQALYAFRLHCRIGLEGDAGRVVLRHRVDPTPKHSPSMAMIMT